MPLPVLIATMRTVIPLLLCVPCIAGADWAMGQLAHLETGAVGPQGSLVVADFEHDGLAEVTFSYADEVGCESWQIWEYAPVNEYRLVRSDTAPGYVPGVHRGYFTPMAAGETEDGKALILGVNPRLFGSPLDSVHMLLCLYVSPTVSSRPDSLAWCYDYGGEEVVWCHGAFPLDLDRDQKQEIVFYRPDARLLFFEERQEGQFALTDSTERHQGGYDFASDDFDQDGRVELVSVRPSRRPYYVLTYRCTSDDKYAPFDSLDQPYTNPFSLCAGDDLDDDSRPEFFVVYAQSACDNYTYIPCMYESNGLGSYDQTVIDSIPGGGFGVSNCTCSDIDCDGREELLVSYKWGVRIYKAVGDNQLEQVWDSWRSLRTAECQVRCYDMNGNGYPEVIVSGGQTWIFELEGVRCTQPAPGEVVRARGEGQSPYVIAWRRFSPPACDSFSLEYTTDNGRTYLPIASGLHDTTYPWMVPDIRSDSCKIRVSAFGPHVLTDETDSCFFIRPLGVEEDELQPVYETKLLGSYPNLVTGLTKVSYQLREQGNVSLVIRDITGRTAATLTHGSRKPGIYDVTWDAGRVSPGIYFLEFQAASLRETRKLTVAR